MRFVTFRHDTPHDRIGLLTADDRLLDLSPLAAQNTLLQFVSAHQDSLEDLQRQIEQTELPTFQPSQVHLQSPIPDPNSVRDCMAFEEHLTNCTRTVVKWKLPPVAAADRMCQRLFGRSFLRPPRVWYQRPIYYKGNPRTVVGHQTDVVWPQYTERLDFELEFGIFIGKQGKNIPVSEAASYILGYTIFNDFSARDVQLAEMQGRLGPAKGKDFDTGNVLGPWLVTPAAVPDPYNLAMSVRVNDELWCETNSCDMHFTFEEIIAYISRDETLYPGDFIGSGTAPGGCGLELDRWLQPGDVVELEVERLGKLRNRVVAPR